MWDKAAGGEIIHDLGKIYETIDHYHPIEIKATFRNGEENDLCIRLRLKESVTQAKSDPDLTLIILYYGRIDRHPV